MLTRCISVVAFAACAPSPASAADFLIFDFHFTGTVSVMSQSGPVSTSKSGPTTGDIVFYLPTTFSLNNLTAYTNLGQGLGPYNDTYIGLSSGNHYSLNETFSALVPRAPTRQINLSGYMSPNASGSGFTIDSSTSSANLSYLIPSVFGGYSQTLSGAIDGLTVTDGFGAAELGFVSAPQAPVPEPTVWASIIVGMGMVGFAIRRRKKAIADPVMRVATR